MKSRIVSISAVLACTTCLSGCYHLTGQIKQTSEIHRTPTNTVVNKVVVEKRIEPAAEFQDGRLVISGEAVEDCEDRTVTTYARSKETTRELPSSYWWTAIGGVVATGAGSYMMVDGSGRINEGESRPLGTPAQEGAYDTGEQLFAIGATSLVAGLLTVGSASYDYVTAIDGTQQIPPVDEVTNVRPYECKRDPARSTVFSVGRGETWDKLSTPPDRGQVSLDVLQSPLARLPYSDPWVRVTCDGCSRQLDVSLPVEMGAHLVVQQDDDQSLAAFLEHRTSVGLGYLVSWCDDSNAAACRLAGQAFAQGLGVGKDKSKYRKFTRKGCDAGSARACFALGRVYQRGDEVERDPAQAASRYKTACTASIEDACDRLKTAQAEVRCRKGNAGSCYTAAVAYKDGSGADVNLQLAATYLERGCKHGNTDSCKLGAQMFGEGRGARRNSTWAVKFYEPLCSSGKADACRALVGLYYDASEPVTDRTRAAYLSLGLCRHQKDAYFCGQYGMMRLRGEGMKRNPSVGFKYLRKACVLGNDRSCYIVERMLNLAQACGNGSGTACLRLERAFYGN